MICWLVWFVTSEKTYYESVLLTFPTASYVSSTPSILSGFSFAFVLYKRVKTFSHHLMCTISWVDIGTIRLFGMGLFDLDSLSLKMHESHPVIEFVITTLKQ